VKVWKANSFHSAILGTGRENRESFGDPLSLGFASEVRPYTADGTPKPHPIDLSERVGGATTQILRKEIDELSSSYLNRSISLGLYGLEQFRTGADLEWRGDQIGELVGIEFENGMNDKIRKTHWENVYSTKGENEVSWFQENPAPSLELIELAKPTPDAAIVDIGGGASRLVDQLLERGFRDVTVLDRSEAALAAAKVRLGDKAAQVQWRGGCHQMVSIAEF
jgi:hypothetical protein